MTALDKSIASKEQYVNVPVEFSTIKKLANEWLMDHYHELLPEEVVLSLRLTKDDLITKLAMRYLI